MDGETSARASELEVIKTLTSTKIKRVNARRAHIGSPLASAMAYLGAHLMYCEDSVSGADNRNGRESSGHTSLEKEFMETPRDDQHDPRYARSQDFSDGSRLLRIHVCMQPTP